MGNIEAAQRRKSIRSSRERERINQESIKISGICRTIHVGNSAYKVTLFVDTMFTGHVDKIVTCCDVRLTKLSHIGYSHEAITRNLEIITPNISTLTPHICAECGDWKTYYKKCV
jgi:hypothetical protein